jgi:hypothetical protein
MKQMQQRVGRRLGWMLGLAALLAVTVYSVAVYAAGETFSRTAVVSGGGSVSNGEVSLRTSFGAPAAGTVNNTTHTLCTGFLCDGITEDGVIDAPGALGFSQSSYTVDESAGTAAITVQRTGGVSGTVTIFYTTGGGSATANQDYTPVSGTLTFENGVNSRTINVPIGDDGDEESDETVGLALSNPTGGASLGSPSTATLTIVDDDIPGQPGAFRYSQSNFAASEGAGAATITVQRTGGTTGDVTVRFTTSDGSAGSSDYTPISGTLTFSDGVSNRTFSVTIADDSDDETDETVNLTLSDPTGGASLGSPAEATLTIEDNDTPGAPGTLQFSQSSYTVGESGGTATITVVRGEGTNGTVTVDYATSNGSATSSDYTSVSGTLTFSNGVANQTFSVTILSDTNAEPDETVNLTLSNPTGGASLGSPSSAALTIQDDDESSSSARRVFLPYVRSSDAVVTAQTAIDEPRTQIFVPIIAR